MLAALMIFSLNFLPNNAPSVDLYDTSEMDVMDHN